MIGEFIEWLHYRMWQRKQAKWMMTRGYCAVPPRSTPPCPNGCGQLGTNHHCTLEVR